MEVVVFRRLLRLPTQKEAATIVSRGEGEEVPAAAISGPRLRSTGGGQTVEDLHR